MKCVPFFDLKPQHVIYSTIHAINVYIRFNESLLPKKMYDSDSRARTQCKCMNSSDTLTHRWIQNNASRFNRVARKGNLQQPKSWSPIHATAIICNQMNENWIWIQTKWKSWMWISINWSKWVNVYEYACGWTFNMRMCTVHSDQRRHIHRVWIKNFPFNPLHRRHYYYLRRCRHFFDYMLVLHIWMDHLMHWNFNWTFNLIKRYETTSLHLNFSCFIFFFVRSFILSFIDCISGFRCFIKTRIPYNQKANGNFDWLTHWMKLKMTKNHLEKWNSNSHEKKIQFKFTDIRAEWLIKCVDTVIRHFDMNTLFSISHKLTTQSTTCRYFEPVLSFSVRLRLILHFFSVVFLILSFLISKHAKSDAKIGTS